VFEVSKGLAEIGWKTARWLYRKGSSGGMVGRLYEKLRNGKTDQPSLLLNLMGQEIVRFYGKSDTPLLVAHPTLVTILRHRPNLIYQHGELIAPDQALVSGAAYVLVPTNDCANRFVAHGYASEQIVVTGLCIELPLVRQATDAFHLRQQRYSGGQPLTGAFFSSGAEPDAHIEALAAAVKSTFEAGHRAVAFAKANGKLARAIPAAVPIALMDESTENWRGVRLLTYHNRREENALTARYFPQFDFLVAPGHERVNWAVGLGLPIFMLEPGIGPFAPRNRDLVLDRNCGESLQSLDDAHQLGKRITQAKAESRLTTMATAGWGKEPINGFDTIAGWLQSKFGG